MKLLDSSALIAFFSSDDEHHAWARSLDLEDGLINEMVVSEMANVLSKRFGNRVPIDQLLYRLDAATTLGSVGAMPWRDWLDCFSKYVGTLSFTDCGLLLQAQQSGCTLVTCDLALARVARSQGVSVDVPD